MAVRGEEVAGSIEAHVREAIERMVGEIRSSVEDVRVAVDSQLKAALQSVQADVKAISFLPHIQKRVGELEEGLKAEKPPAPPPAAGDAVRAKKAIQAVERARTQIDVLNGLLEQCLNFGSRAALLILRGETFSGWKGVGFSAHGGNDELVKRFNAAPGLIPELDRVLQQAARRDDVPWTRDVVPFAKGLVPEYLSAADEAEMMPWYEDFAERYGLLLGPAARRATATETAPSRAAA